MSSRQRFIPMSLEEAAGQGIRGFDVVIVTGDAYVDHPSFGAAIVGRHLQSLGLDVGIIAQPDWRSSEDFRKLGRPRLFFGVTAGNLDSMVALYTAGRKIRSDDAYSEGGVPGRRPYLPTLVYTQRLKEAFPEVPVLLGGVEASLRRICHYDYYRDKLRPSVLLDAKADLLVYGNAEAALSEIVSGLKSGKSISELRGLRGTAVPLGGKIVEELKKKELFKEPTSKHIKRLSAASPSTPGTAVPHLRDGGLSQAQPFFDLGFEEIVRLPSFEEISADRRLFMEMTLLALSNMSPYNGRAMIQESAGRAVLVNPPALPLSAAELDRIYELPFTRRPHPSYAGEIPALRTVEASFVSHRGCFGGCSFCSLYFHQGKFIQSRSPESLEREIAGLVRAGRGKPLVVTDVGGPTANMYGLGCKKTGQRDACGRRSCLFPGICANLDTDQKRYAGLLDRLARIPGVKAVYVNSGVRFDLAICDRDFIRALVKRHVQGRLSAAPEHVDAEVLRLMGKPPIEVFDKFVAEFYSRSGEAGRKQFVVPYFIIGHPGADDSTERKLAGYVRLKKIRAEQIQEFYPTPMALSTAIYYTGLDVDGKPAKVERSASRRKSWKTMVQGLRS